MKPPVISPNAHATVDYELRDDDGDLLDASEADGGKPIRYVHGYGMLVPGLESALCGMGAGEERDVIVPPEAGYGDYDDELVLEIARSDLPDPARVSVGDELVAESPDGDELALSVIDVSDDTVVVDGNHPLAGVTLRYHLKVRDVRLATDEEIQRAATEFNEAEQHMHGHDGHVAADPCGHAAGCDHSHEPIPLSLASLGGPPVARRDKRRLS